jgi:hypothetical protein
MSLGKDTPHICAEKLDARDADTAKVADPFSPITVQNMQQTPNPNLLPRHRRRL